MGKIYWDDLDGGKSYSKWRRYGQTKLANLLFTAELNRQAGVHGTFLIAAAAHPGYSATNLSIAGPGQSGAKKAWTAAIRLGDSLIAQACVAGAIPQIHAATAHDVVGNDYYGPSGFGEQRGWSTKRPCRAPVPRRTPPTPSASGPCPRSSPASPTPGPTPPPDPGTPALSPRLGASRGSWPRETHPKRGGVGRSGIGDPAWSGVGGGDGLEAVVGEAAGHVCRRHVASGRPDLGHALVDHRRRRAHVHPAEDLLPVGQLEQLAEIATDRNGALFHIAPRPSVAAALPTDEDGVPSSLIHARHVTSIARQQGKRPR